MDAASIDARRTQLDAEVAKQSAPVDKKGAADADRALAEAQEQAQATRENGQTRSADVRSHAKIEAQNARVQGARSGDEARKAAQIQAARVPGDADNEKAGITAMAEQRRAMALIEAETRANAIETKAETEAQKILQQAEKDAQAQIQRGQMAADQARTNAVSGTWEIKGERDKAHANMQSISNEAVGKMKAAQGEADAKAKGESGTASGTMAGAQKDAKTTADTEKADALAKMQHTYDTQKKKIEDKGKAELAKIAIAKDSDLCHLEKQVNGDLKAMEKLAEEADARMKGQVKLAERRLAAKVLQQKHKIRAAAIKAMGAIDKFVAEAKRKIHQADKGVSKAIADAGKAGKKAVADMGPKALATVTQANQDDLEGTIKAAGAERAALDLGAEKIKSSITTDAGAVEGAIKDRMVEEALAQVKGDLVNDWSWTSDGQAKHAVDLLGSLPKDARAQAMKELPDEQFATLLDEVPNERKNDFKALAKATDDPKRKASLMDEYRKSHEDEIELTNTTAFAKGGADKHDVDINDINQDQVGDCFLLSSMGAMANKNPEGIKKLISENRDEDGDLISYTVTLHKKVDGKWVDEPINVDPSWVPKDGHHAKLTGDKDGGQDEMWPLIIEKAYAAKHGGYKGIDGGWPADAMEELSGVDSEKKTVGKYSYEDLEKDLNAKKGVAFSTVNEGMTDKISKLFCGNPHLGHGLHYGHSYTVTGVETDASGKKWVVVNNPWGPQSGENPTVRVPYDEVKDNFDDIAVNAGMAPK